MNIVSVELAKAHIRNFGPNDGELIALYIDAAEAWSANYIGKPLAEFDPVPGDLKLAVLKLAAFHYEQREAVAFGDAMRIAPFSVQSVLDAYRERWFGESDG